MRRLALLLATGAACSSEPVDIRLTVYQVGEPVAGATVWFDDPITGEELDRGTTGDDGAFGGSAPDGATISAAIPSDDDPPSWQVYTLVGAEVGEELWVGDRQARDNTELGTLSVALDGPVTDGWTYEVAIGCINQTTMDPTVRVEVPVFASCLSATGKVVVRAEVFAFGDSVPIAFVPARLVQAPAGSGTVNVDLPAWQTELATLEVDLTGIPADAIAHSDIRIFHDGVAFGFDAVDSDAGSGDSLTHTHAYIPGDATRLRWNAALRNPDGVQMRVASTATPPPTTAVVDFTTDLLPPITAVVGATGADGSPTLTWLAGADLAGDGMIATAYWTNADGSSVNWSLFAPVGDERTLGFPPLRGAAAAAAGADGGPVQASVFAVEADDIDGYADFRSGAGQDMLNQAAPTAEQNGRVSVGGQFNL